MSTLAKLCAGTCLALLPAVALAQSYAIIDLTPGSGFDATLAYGVSQNGKITGVGIAPVTGEYHVFIYQGGALQDLGMLGYPYGADGVAINNSGQVAATGYGPGYHALRYSNGHVTTLGSIDGGNSEGLSINNLGHIVGRAQNGDGGYQAFLYDGTLNVLNGYIARSINDSDQVTGSMGYCWTQNNKGFCVGHAFLLSGGVYTDLGNLGGGLRTNTEGYGINSAGDVTGYSTLSDGTIHAFKYSAGTMSDLGTIDPYYTYGYSINSHGDVIGSIETYVGDPVGSFLYSNGVLRDLSDLLSPSDAAAWSQLTALQINDSGWIVGYGTLATDGNTHGFVIRPIPPADMNCDGLVDGNDIPGLVLALLDPAGYSAAYPACNSMNADVNADGSVTTSDISPFISRLLAP